MLCQNCQQKIASIHYTQIVNGHKVEFYLCSKCANQNSAYSFVPQFGASDFLSGLMGINHHSSKYTVKPQQTVCKKCGMSYEDFQKVGRLGCSHCYEAHGGKLDSVIKRLHGNVEYVGKSPLKTSTADRSTSTELQNLKQTLTDLIKKEEYEKAAEIRDKIRELEKDVQKKGGD